MLDAIVTYLQQFPPVISTIILASLPITELRLAIPVAMNVWLISPYNAFGLALIGNFIPFFPLFFGLRFIRRFAVNHWPWMLQVVDTQLERAQKKVEKKYARYGAFALFLFTALPLPLTGLWMATIAAVALKIPFKYAVAGIGLGIITAGLIVTGFTLSAEVWF
ncbi:ligand-binding protein SH3 [Candidatus Uhrbacteria bacterium CG10_big_fil_rev_8_21_14_0_10_41_26]|nr:MAG: ligand-binding protein SH3 [Candidatus Uhrbacteria bacterium CG_4_10_14_3_um_filter_41_21]PJB84291.1 MAG: ligand-binding protein SH3 [Candidatus Uhrbacteria bacterium CG_4_9_14_0_8_um_filter_41_16]PJE74861.1 MAG: ligand-binding protein SH3 [Candidatus Uhrbacteria bacterium CG10_big_fil_rev_8_21_14_0_10_41_26]